MLFDDEQSRPRINVKDPVIVVWRVRGIRKEKQCDNLKQGRAYAIRVLGGDDRMEARLFDAKTKEKRGKVGIFGGQPYWNFGKDTWSMTNKGELLKDWFDYA